MPVYSYSALARDGKSQDGSIQAQSPEHATRQLRSQGLTLLRIEEGAAVSGAARSGKFGRKEVLSLTSELAVLLRAGLPLDRSLKVLVEMASTDDTREVLESLLKAVKSGRSFSDALGEHKDAFGNFYINMIRSGELSGQMTSVLDRLVEYLENSKAARESVISALIYPAILLVVAVLSIVAMLGFVVPQFEAMFDDMGEALPAMTQMVIGMANGVKDYGIYIIILLVLAGSWLRNWLSSETGRRTFDTWLLGLPLAGNLVFEFEMAKFARTLGTLQHNGVALLKAISIAIDTVENAPIKEALNVLPPAVKSGERIYKTLEKSERFTPMIVQMVRIGEESGRLDHMMLELARVFDQNVQSGVKRGLTLIEPALILTMGAVIAFIILSILMGILSVNDLAG